MLVISIDDPDKLAKYVEKEGIGYPMLTDPGSETIKSYGFLNEKQGKIPHPAAVVINQEGCVTYIRVDENVVDRPPVDELLEALDNPACS